jgi:hypothetical protein
MEQSEFDKITAALDRAEFAMQVVRLRAEEFRRKSDAAKSVEEIADLHLEATEILHQLVKISTAVDTAIQPLISGWCPIQGKKHPPTDGNRRREGVCLSLGRSFSE